MTTVAILDSDDVGHPPHEGARGAAPLIGSPSDEAVAAFLERDVAWGAYLLADLCPPMREHARFYLADDGLVCVYEPPEFRVVCTAGALGAWLDACPLPTSTALVVELAHRAIFDARYDVPRWDPMRRMVLARPPTVAAWDDARLLAMPDLPALTSLLGSREGFAPFTADMLRHGVYAGVRVGGELVAVAGTHVVAPERRVAALGNVFTAPDARGRGLAAAATALVIEELYARGCDRIVLNVAADNDTATRLYGRLGFEVACDFWEAPEAIRRT
jgi:ribosomal protein S18 acetylase RimI-like enzyme